MKRFIYILMLLGSVGLMSSSTQYYKVDKDKSTLKVHGTSTLHDWTIEAENMTGEARFAIIDDQLDISTLQFNVPVTSLKSGKSAMDNNTYKALDSKAHPYIRFAFIEGDEGEFDDGSYELKAKGDLTIAGVSKKVTLPVKAKVSTNAITFTGKTTFKMTDYKVEPPTALMGTIKTGDEITVEFSITYLK